MQKKRVEHRRSNLRLTSFLRPLASFSPILARPKISFSLSLSFDTPNFAVTVCLLARSFLRLSRDIERTDGLKKDGAGAERAILRFMILTDLYKLQKAKPIFFVCIFYQSMLRKLFILVGFCSTV